MAEIRSWHAADVSKCTQNFPINRTNHHSTKVNPKICVYYLVLIHSKLTCYRILIKTQQPCKQLIRMELRMASPSDLILSFKIWISSDQP